MVAVSTMSTAVPLGAAVPSLVRWGLSVDADLVFRTLTTFGPRSQHTLTTELGLSRQRITDAVGELRAAGAAVAAADGGMGTRQSPVWYGRPPADVIATLRSRRLRLVDPVGQADRHFGLVRALADRLSGAGIALDPTTAAGIAGHDVRAFPTRALARARLTELRTVERYDRLVINTEQVFDRHARAVGPSGSRSLVERNINVRIIGVPPADGDRSQPGEELVNQTTYRIREALHVPLKLFILDHRIAFFPIDPLDFERGYLEVTHRGVVDALVSTFESQWSTATDPVRHGVPQILLSEREQALIDLLAAGHTDISAAEHLRISARSVTNIMRALMDRVGVDNRFQLGLTLGTMRAAAPPPLRELLVPHRPTLVR
jgi:DNA-binding CsgD family transcriptional regulator/biotin operon repressor